MSNGTEPNGHALTLTAPGAIQLISAVDKLLLVRITAVEYMVKAVDKKAEDANESLEKLLRSEINGVSELTNANFKSSAEAVRVFQEANELHFDSVNEFRKTLVDQARGFASQKEVDAKFDAVEKSLWDWREVIVAKDEALATAQSKRDANTADLIAVNSSKIAQLTGQMYVGGSGIFVLLVVLQLVLNYAIHPATAILGK